MALSCISSEIKPDIGRKSWFLSYPLHSAPPLEGPRLNIAISFVCKNYNGGATQRWKTRLKYVDASIINVFKSRLIYIRDNRMGFFMD